MAVYRKKTKNGKSNWVAKFYYTDWNGQRRQKKREGFKTKREAQNYERDFHTTAINKPSMKFKNLVEIYLEDCKSRLKPTTYANKEHIFSKKLNPFFSEVPINEISPSMVRIWQNKLLSSEANYSDTYLKTINNQLSAVLNYGVRFYGMQMNAARICGSIGKKNADNINFWTVEEFLEFTKYIEDKPASIVIFNILFWTGIRSGELLALSPSDWDFKNNLLSINKNYARHNGEDLILTPKTNKSTRQITIPPFLKSMVEAYILSQPDLSNDERMFKVTKHYLRHEVIRGSKFSGLKRIRVHDFRHSHASLLIEQGVSPLLISERLGHESIETTLQTYSHLYPNKHEEVALQLNELQIKITQ